MLGTPYMWQALDHVLNLSAKSVSFWEMITPPKDISTYGHKITSLFFYITYLDIFYFVLVCLGLFGFSYLYAKKRHPKPYYTYGNKKKHLLATLVIGLAVFLSIDMTIAYRSNQDLLDTFWNWPDPSKEEVVKIQVQGQQWAWNFRYAGPDEEFNTLDDIVTMNDLRIPMGTKVTFQITSKDVIHSFYLPNFRMKVDAIPGRVTRMWVEATETGDFEIACAEMCGTYHYKMAAKLKVYTKEDFIAWRDEARVIAESANDPDYASNLWGWKWEN